MEHFQIPVLPEHYLDRKRISCLLEENTGVCFVTGKRGCGKTSALAQFFQGKESSVFWYSFQKEDNLEPVLYKNLKTAAGCLVQSLDEENGGSGQNSIWKLLEEMEVAYIVFDDVQMLVNEKVLYALRAFLEGNAGRHKIFLAVSGQPAPCFSRFLAAGNYKTVSDAVFCFTHEEAGQLFRMYFKELPEGSVEEKYASHFIRLTGGWPVAAACLLRFLKETGSLDSFFDMRPLDVLLDTVLYDYIEYELYGMFSAKEKQLLVQTAEFRRIDAGLAGYCFGQDVQGRFFRKVRGKKLMDGQQYEPLFRLFLQQQQTQQQRRKIREQAGEYYLKQEDFTEAFFYMEDNPQAVRRLLLDYGKKLLHRELTGLAGQCFAVLNQEPAEWSAKELELAAEYYYRTGNLQKMEACLNAADSMFGKENQYGMYRSLYRGLFHYEQNPEKYKELVNNAIFFLEENKIPFPFLMDKEQEMLQKIRMEKESGRRKDSEKKLKVSAFGTFRAVILSSNRELAWRTKKGCELFAYLLDLNGEAVERRTLLTQLWSEEIPDNAVAMLHNMIYNIRKELSYYNLEHLIQYKNRKYSMDTEIIESDLEQIRAAAKAVEKKDLEALLQKKSQFNAPWGLYLENLDSAWIRDRQEYYEKIFEKGCLMLGEACSRKGDYETAAEYYRNALMVNCYSEKIMARLLQCYGCAGELGSAKKQYEEFCVLLKQELDILPGEELKICYRECMSRIKRG